MLRLRVLSAVVLIPVILVIVALGEPWLALLVAVVVGLALHEAYGLAAAAGLRPVRWAGFLGALFLVLVALAAPSAETGCGCPLQLPGAVGTPWPVTIPPNVGIGAALAGAILVTLIGQLLRRDRGGALASWGLTLALALYVAWPLAHFILLRELSRPAVPPFWSALGLPPLSPGFWWILYTFLMVWLGDSAAYFIGSRWGRHKLSPYLSPKKSWEGGAAGLLSSIAVGIGLVPLLGLDLAYYWAALLGVLAGILALLGDLAESLLKRQAGVKDSGRLIPGHGGMLDRVDSLLFVVPAVYYFLQIVPL